MQRSAHAPAKSQPSQRGKAGDNLNRPRQERLVKVIQSAEFQPLCEPYKSGLYAEKDLIKSVIEGSNELLANLKDENGEYIFKENQTFSNFAIITGLIAAISGLFCFFLPFNTTCHMTILALAVIYGLLITILSVVESCITENLVTTIRPKNFSDTESINVLAHLDIESKSVRLLLAPYKGIRSTLKSISCNPLYLLQPLCGRNIFSCFNKAPLPKELQPQGRKNGGSLLTKEQNEEGNIRWFDIYGGAGSEFRASVEIVKTGAEPSSGLTSSKKDDDQSSTRVLLMEKPLTKYFDTNGFLLGKSVAEDLRELFTIFFDQ